MVFTRIGSIVFAWLFGSVATLVCYFLILIAWNANLDSACESPPKGYGIGNWEPTLWNLGARCVYRGAGEPSIVTYEPGWEMTVLMAAWLLLLAVVAAVVSHRSATGAWGKWALGVAAFVAPPLGVLLAAIRRREALSLRLNLAYALGEMLMWAAGAVVTFVCYLRVEAVLYFSFLVHGGSEPRPSAAPIALLSMLALLLCCVFVARTMSAHGHTGWRYGLLVFLAPPLGLLVVATATRSRPDERPRLAL